MTRLLMSAALGLPVFVVVSLAFTGSVQVVGVAVSLAVFVLCDAALERVPRR